MNKVFTNLQREFATIQKSLKAQGDELVKRVKEQTTKENLVARGKEIEKLVEKELKRVEPAVNKFLVQLRKNAKKAGIDLNQIEKSVRSKIAKATKTTTKKASTAAKRPAAKRSPSKASTKRTNGAASASPAASTQN